MLDLNLNEIGQKLFRKEKKIQADKPGSVEFYHLSSPNITTGINQPTHQDRTSRPQALAYLVFQPIRFT